MVKVVFSPNAVKNIRDIMTYYQNCPARVLALKARISKGVEVLSAFPLAGQNELIVQSPLKSCRSLVIDKDYKLLYDILDDSILVLSIWDCRQDPLKLFDVLP